MKCENKEIHVGGLYYDDERRDLCVKRYRVIITNDEKGRTLSIDDGKVQFSIPFEPLDKYLRKD